MPRIGRLVIPNYPHHIIHRGHNRSPVFAVDDDYLYYLENLFELKTKLGCKLYAYCLMTNHVHLIVDPGNDTEALALLMKGAAARQTRYVNRLERRTGTLWEGRYRSSIVCKDSYLMACCRYVEMNPVRALIVGAPNMYRWSSYSAKIGNPVLFPPDPDPFYLDLGKDEPTRHRKYAEWVLSSVPEGEWERIRRAVQSAHPIGDEKFASVIAEKIGIRLENRVPGRPRKIRDK